MHNSMWLTFIIWI